MLRSFLAALTLSVAIISPVLAADAFNATQRAEMNSAIKQFIIDNPQVLISSVEAYYNKQNKEKQAQEGPIKTFPAGLLDYPNNPYAGPKDGKVVIVEFFDYNCGYCKQVANDLQRVIDEEKHVKIIFKDLPILSDTSEVAARYALASNKQGKYVPYHMALLHHQGPISEEFLTETAKSVGLDVEKLKKDANTQDVRDMLAKNVELARELGVRGTPFFIVGREKIPGAVGYGRLKEMIDAEMGVKPAAPAAEEPAAKADVKADTVAPTPAPAAAAPSVSSDPEAQAEIEKARAEARAMIDEIKAEATKMQKEAEDAAKAAEKPAAKK
jgi:protein-disulfide isomerase